ncbi:cell division protein FtsL [Roseobacter sp.]|uniref:cell division protein FtsL n=1 Tax=Roseobacter sp. TaxID=1907202 RepID=UPI0025D38D0C|nr:cell division protein FtsL [Roseobacter sp.]
MRTVFYILTTLSVIGLAFWAYRENYATQGALAETRALRQEIREAHERLTVLRAEWAYLNRPDRLRDLADINFDRLGLLPLRPDQFGHIDQVAYPPAPELEFTDGVDVSNLVDGAAPSGVTQ